MSTISRSFRLPADLWREAAAKAEAEGTTLTAVIVRALRWYVSQP